MAYTGNIDTGDPLGSEKAKLGAGRIRDLALALRERLASVFMNPDVDPLALKPGTVDNSQLVDGSVNTGKLADGSVSHAKMQDGNVELANLSAAAKAGLATWRVLGVLTFPIVVLPIPANSCQWYSFAVAAEVLGKPLMAYWSATPAASLAADAAQQACSITPMAKGLAAGALICNHTGAPMSLQDHEITIAVLERIA